MAREMKDSGIPWVVSIPHDWEVTRGKNVLTLQKREVRPADEVVTCFRDGEVILRSERRTEGFTISEKEIGYQGINKGDIVIHGMDGFAGSMGVSKSTGKGSPVLVVCTPRFDADPNYIIYYLRSLAMTNVFLALSTGIRERSCDLRWNKISELEFILPSSQEQQRIAAYLDEKCEDIDNLVSVEEGMIEELQAYKQSVITEAVTKGLDPDVPMKDSGITYIAKIPTAWHTPQLKFITSKIGSGSTPSGGATAYVSEGVKFLRSQNVHNEGFSLDDVAHITNEIHEQMKGTKVRPGDILFNITGGSIGRCYIVDETLGEANVNQHVSIVRPSSIQGKFLMYFLQSSSGQEQVNLLQTGGNREGLSASAFGEFFVCQPPLPEQQRIAAYLDEKCADIDALIAIKRGKIEELKEYKKSLIYEAVTGKIDLSA